MGGGRSWIENICILYKVSPHGRDLFNSEHFLSLDFRHLFCFLAFQDFSRVVFFYPSSAVSVSQPSAMSEFLIKDEDLASLKGKVVVLTGNSIQPLYSAG